MGRRRRADIGESGHELNLIPYLDVMVNLVIFMLMNITSFLSFTILNASIPQLSINPDTKQPESPKKELLLMVRLMDGEIVLDPNVQGGPSMERKTFPNVKNKEGKVTYDFEALKKEIVTIKGQFTEEKRVLIFAKPAVVYEDIIGAMDTVRDKVKPGDGELFPDVTLSVL